MLRQPRTILSACLIAASITSTAWSRQISFEERVTAEGLLEQVRHSHRVGALAEPAQAAGREVLEKRVRSLLAESVALEKVWGTPVTGEMLEAELDRMIRNSRMPGRLREYFAALGGDPLMIQEAIARPALVRRLTRSFFDQDRRIHAAERALAESLQEQLAAGRLDPRNEHPMRTVVEETDREHGRAISHDETAEAFIVDAVFLDPEGRDRIARYVVRKRSWDDWWKDVAHTFDVTSIPTVAAPGITPSLGRFLADESSIAEACEDGTWNNASLDDVPDPRHHFTTVWTGSEMIVWGGYNLTITLNSGGRYDPAIDHWEPVSRVKAPAARYFHTAVWTGTRMIVWGGMTTLGGDLTNSGSAYDPVTDLWKVISDRDAPDPRRLHTAVWTGSEMIVWGGTGFIGTGGRYDPVADVWTAVSTVDAPSGREWHTAIWTGSEMIVWGGMENDLAGEVVNTGGLYDPTTDSWTPTSTPAERAPVPRRTHTAVWTGSTMIVWGGEDAEGTGMNTGGIYDPLRDHWFLMSEENVPDARDGHVAVWTGSEMVVWGGYTAGGNANTGGRYDPESDEWTETNVTGAPAGRIAPGAVWDGSRMIVWGGLGLRLMNSGGRYDPAGDSWTPTSRGGAPAPRHGATAVWTGTEMIVWGGRTSTTDLDTGGRYDPALDSWSDTATTGAPEPRLFHSAVWSGDVMVVWGGTDTGSDTGGRYDPVTDSWTPTSTTGAPSARHSHTAVWTGAEMIVWGGYEYAAAVFLDTGARYDPAGDTWSPISTAGAPSSRRGHTAVWTGSRMIVWGGESPVFLDTGGIYDPGLDAWTGVDVTDAPAARREHTAVWSGSEMIVWGGNAMAAPLIRNDGGRYDPVLDAWSPVSVEPLTPSSRHRHAAVWSGSEMIVWGGRIPGSPMDVYPETGGRYSPDTDSWSPVTNFGAPTGRSGPSAIWTGSEMILWGGANSTMAEVSSGGRYCGCASITYYRDADGDGQGDSADAVEACAAPEGYVALPGDCDDGDGSIWSAPGEVLDVRFTDSDSLSWTSPAEPGGVTPVYDVVRSEDPEDFVSASTCVAWDILATGTEDDEAPASGFVFHYLVRAESGCPAGQGPLGDRSDGWPREARVCP